MFQTYNTKEMLDISPEDVMACIPVGTIFYFAYRHLDLDLNKESQTG